MMSTIGRMPVIAAPTAEAGEPGLRDRRVNDAILAELFDQAFQHLERACRPRRRPRPRARPSGRVASLPRSASRIASPKVSSRTRRFGRRRPVSSGHGVSGIDILVDSSLDRDTARSGANSTAASISAASFPLIAIKRRADRPDLLTRAMPRAALIGIALRHPALLFLLSAGSIRARCRRHGGRETGRCSAAGTPGPSPLRARVRPFSMPRRRPPRTS